MWTKVSVAQNVAFPFTKFENMISLPYLLQIFLPALGSTLETCANIMPEF